MNGFFLANRGCSRVFRIWLFFCVQKCAFTRPSVDDTWMCVRLCVWKRDWLGSAVSWCVYFYTGSVAKWVCACVCAWTLVLHVCSLSDRWHWAAVFLCSCAGEEDVESPHATQSNSESAANIYTHTCTHVCVKLLQFLKYSPAYYSFKWTNDSCVYHVLALTCYFSFVLFISKMFYFISVEVRFFVALVWVLGVFSLMPCGCTEAFSSPWKTLSAGGNAAWLIDYWLSVRFLELLSLSTTRLCTHSAHTFFLLICP